MSSSGSNGREMALSGIRIIDFGQGIIDPMATGYLADFGAEVIKVESYSRLDFARRGESFLDEKRDPDQNLIFARVNQNKYGVLINLKQPKGVELAKKLVSLADVVTENLSVGVIQRLGLGYEELCQVKPDIIMLSASFAGQTGPYRNFRGPGNVIAALEGIDDLTGWPDRGPTSPAQAFVDFYVPWLWATIIIAALKHRHRTGKGQFIDASSFEGCLDTLDTAVADYVVNGRVLTRQGNRHRAAAPHGVYRCRGEDRWCSIAVSSDEEWQSFCQVLGNPAWTSETRFSTLLGRLQNADELDRLVDEWTQSQQAEEVIIRLQGAGVTAEVVKNAKDIHEDPQLAHRGHFWKPEDPGLEAYTFEAPSARLSLTPARLQRRHPLLGEHNAYVFFDLLGLDPEEYSKLVDEQVIF